MAVRAPLPLLLLLAALRPDAASAALLTGATPLQQQTTPQPPARPASSSPQLLDMIEHEMPLMAEPSRYEEMLRSAMAPHGEVIRWYIGRVDEARGTAIAECVILRHGS